MPNLKKKIINCAHNNNKQAILVSFLGNLIRFMTVLIFLLMVFGEMIIYIKICYSLWKHDEKMKEMISTENLQLRKRKNIITLSGQAFSFFLEFLGILLLITKYTNNDVVDPSLTPIIKISFSCIISLTQLWTSHELKQYIKFRLMDYNLL